MAKAFDPEMLLALAIGLFAGLRRSELFALDWSEIDHEHRTIEVKGIKAKTRQRRLVSVTDNLLVWLNPHRKASGAISLTGGTTTVYGDIYATNVASAAPRTATVTLNGASAVLDLTGHVIGGTDPAINNNANYIQTSVQPI